MKRRKFLRIKEFRRKRRERVNVATPENKILKRSMPFESVTNVKAIIITIEMKEEKNLGSGFFSGTQNKGKKLWKRKYWKEGEKSGRGREKVTITIENALQV